MEKVDPSKSDPHFRIVFENAPSCIHALPMAPPAREPELRQGTWLVLAWGVSSQTDKNCIDVAVRGVARYGGAVQLGVRPFLYDEEMLTWFPEYGGSMHGSPVWVVLRDGAVVKSEVSPLDDKALTAFLGQALH